MTCPKGYNCERSVNAHKTQKTPVSKTQAHGMSYDFAKPAIKPAIRIFGNARILIIIMVWCENLCFRHVAKGAGRECSLIKRYHSKKSVFN